jgi:acyl-lipid (7-3)-desaturase (Delta-4 desaturase)
MAPNAEKLRQRNGATKTTLNGLAADVDDVSSTSTAERLCSLSSLKGHEVCIDGIIYDIANFDHPGGDTFRMFGGNDVTVQYNMIHPYHTAKHLQKMTRVGKVVDYTCEYVQLHTRYERTWLFITLKY